MDYTDNATEESKYSVPLSEAISTLSIEQKEEIRELLQANQTQNNDKSNKTN